MPPLWTAFTVGLFLGAVAGGSILSLCVAAKQADDHIEEMTQQAEQHSASKSYP